MKVLAIVIFPPSAWRMRSGSGRACISIPNLWSHDGFAPKGVWFVIAGVAVVIFSYFGTEIAVMAAAESIDPAKGIRQATSTVIWRILLFFVGGVLVIVTIVPWNELPNPKDTAPFAYIFGLGFAWR